MICLVVDASANGETPCTSYTNKISVNNKLEENKDKSLGVSEKGCEDVTEEHEEDDEPDNCICHNCHQMDQIERGYEQAFANAEAAINRLKSVKDAAKRVRDEAANAKKWAQEEAEEAAKVAEQAVASIMIVQQALEAKMQEYERKAVDARSKDEAADQHLQKAQKTYEKLRESKQLNELLYQLQVHQTDDGSDDEKEDEKESERQDQDKE